VTSSSTGGKPNASCSALMALSVRSRLRIFMGRLVLRRAAILARFYINAKNLFACSLYSYGIKGAHLA